MKLDDYLVKQYKNNWFILRIFVSLISYKVLILEYFGNRVRNLNHVNVKILEWILWET
jgi:hypothetical protein